MTIIRTSNSIYEVQEAEHRFRRITGSPTGALLSGWHRFERFTHPVPGAPVRFFLRHRARDARCPTAAAAMSLGRLSYIDTSPVVEVFPDEGPSFPSLLESPAYQVSTG